ncbi:MAG: TA system antitoxin ParD family protein [Fluviibacter sp.]
MAVAMKISDELVNDAKPYAAAEHRSVPKQIEYWARIGKAVTENPDLPVAMVREILLARQEQLSEQATEYTFG